MKPTPIAQCTPQNAYNRGLAQVAAKVRKLRAEYNAAFKAIADRAVRAESGQGLGPCSKCRFFHRDRPDHRWGKCNMAEANKLQPDWPAPWAHMESAGYKMHHYLLVSEVFGCVLFARKK